MTLKKYIVYKLGNHTDPFVSMKHKLKSSFLAPAFRKFWQNWNPVWSFFLIYYIYKPLKKLFSDDLSLLLRFVVSGFIHDCIGILLMQRLSYKMTIFSLS